MYSVSENHEETRVDGSEQSFTRRFAALFKGLDSGYGRYNNLAPPNEDGKRIGSDRGWVQGKPTPELYELHLTGKSGLGIAPIRADSTCMFGAIDVDDYSINHIELIKNIRKHGLPIIVCRSKSGGAHLYIFTSEPVQARIMRARLKEIAALLGYEGVETFPKQSKIIKKANGKLTANFINLPYHGPLTNLRYALTEEGDPIELEDFLDLAESLKQSPKWFEAPLPTELPGAPPCLRKLVQIGFATGTRNNGLFNFGVYARKAYSNDWQIRLADMNQSYMQPPLTPDEVTQVINSLGREDYFYKCGDAPIDAYCDKKACKKCEHGIGGGPKPRAVLATIGNQFELFHDPKDKAYAKLPIGDHIEVWAVESRKFRKIATGQFYEREQKAPSDSELNAFISTLAIKAELEGRAEPVYLRVAHTADAVYLDLCNERWQVVKVTPEGWEVLDRSPVAFRRAEGMLPIPTPVRGGNLEDLRPMINAKEDWQWVLIVAWLLAVFQPCGTFPSILFQGGQGSGKSLMAELLRRLIDPASVALSSPPKDERDLAIAVCNGAVAAFDNLSGCPAWLADALCRVLSGAGFRTRKLYTDDEETLIETHVPVMLTGIDELALRGDLAERSLRLELSRIETRRTETEIRRAFEAARPKILGALLSIVRHGLKALPDTQVSDLPRLADFITWVVACESALPWTPGTFLEAYRCKHGEAAEVLIENDVVASYLERQFKKENLAGWKFTSRQPLDLLKCQSDYDSRSGRWPADVGSLGKWLRRCEPPLRTVGLSLEYSREAGTGRRLWEIKSVSQPNAKQVAEQGNLPLENTPADHVLIDELRAECGERRSAVDDEELPKAA